MVGGAADDFAGQAALRRRRQDRRPRRAATAAGQTVKAANQLIVAANIQALAEAVVFLEAYGVDTSAALDVLGGGLAGSKVLDQKRDNMLTASFEPGFRIDLHHKDMGIVTSAAREAGVVVPLGGLVAQLMASRPRQRRRRPRPLGPAARRRAPLRPALQLTHPQTQPTGIPKTQTRSTTMARMTAAQAAVEILKKEGVTNVFGLPGAAINPFYKAMKTNGGLHHTLARHVEGASHMAEGYTRAKAGNIGVCVGTSGPAGTDMITGLYSASADSIPILCITGQAPVAKLHKEDFQAVDIASIAKPLTKMAVTVLEAAQVPGTFQQAFHLMRSGRPGPVLIDLPIDVQMTEIEFDVETYAPLPVYKPAATRAQVEKALDMLAASERPLIVAGGGIINADAADLLVEFAELTGVPVVPTLMGWGTHPRRPRAQRRHGRAADQPPLRQRHDARVRLRPGHRQPLGQPPHRRRRDLHQGPHLRARRHRADPDRPGLRPRLRHRLRRQGRARAVRRGRPRAAVTQGRARRPLRVGAVLPRPQAHSMWRKTNFDVMPVKPQRVYQEMNRAFGKDVRYVSHDRPVPDPGGPAAARLQGRALDQRRPGRAARLDRPGRPRRRHRRPRRDRRRAVR